MRKLIAFAILGIVINGAALIISVTELQKNKPIREVFIQTTDINTASAVSEHYQREYINRIAEYRRRIDSNYNRAILFARGKEDVEFFGPEFRAYNKETEDLLTSPLPDYGYPTGNLLINGNPIRVTSGDPVRIK